MGRGLAGIALSGLMLMMAVVNRGVAAGSGHGLRYGASVLALWRQYITLLLKRALKRGSVGVLELGSIAVLLWSLLASARAIWQDAMPEIRHLD